MKVENTDQADMCGSACHYDWNASTEAVEAPERRTILDRATDTYRSVEACAVKAIPAMRKLALPVAAVMVLAGLGVGTTLLYDPPAIREAAALASMEARAEPEEPVVVAAAQPEADVIQGIPAPSTHTTSPAAPGDISSDRLPSAAATAAKTSIQPELAYQPDRATMTGSIPAAVLAAAVKDTHHEEPAEPAASSDDDAAASTRKGQIRTAVNMRASPDKDAKVLAVVPAKASVSVIECKSWCRIAFDGQEGYVYKRYVR
ncbi:MAG: SH3 domain-containing protein [Pseudaminobacter sp.]